MKKNWACHAIKRKEETDDEKKKKQQYNAQ